MRHLVTACFTVFDYVHFSNSLCSFYFKLGYFCKSGVNTSKPSSWNTGNGGRCYPGHECPSGTGTPSPCQQGYYAPVSQMESCSFCPEG